jgi:transposase
MTMERITMRKIREVLRLKYTQSLSNTQIGTSCNLSKECVRKYIKRAERAGLSWPLPEEMNDTKLEQLLFKDANQAAQIPCPDWLIVHQELKKKGVTLMLLWEEYRAVHPDGYQYSRFCELYRAFKNKLDPVMRQTHKAGEKLFVDFSGLTVPWIDRETGEIFQAEIFVAVLGASNYTYVEACESQSLPCWIEAHVRALEFIGGVPNAVVPDNLKAGVTKAHYYDPDINMTYQDFGCHYGLAIIPARANSPKDKSKVEVGVQGIQRRILAPLRHYTFFSVSDINRAMTPLLKEYNQRSFQDLPGSRLSQFLQSDKPALRPLPIRRYEYAQWRRAKVNIDYHVAFEKHFYSVPHVYIKEEITLRTTKTTVECYYKNQRIASHLRSYRPGHTTIKEHMPKAHLAHVEWTPERLIGWAKKIGPSTLMLIESVIQSRPIPEQSFRACLGILRLGKSYGESRLENAAKRALAIGATRYQSIESILKRGLDGQPLPVADPQPTALSDHANVRGARYYH